MKPLIVIGILLMLAGLSVNMQIPGAGSWMFQAGLIFLFGALSISRKEKIWAQAGLLFMVALFLWGFVSGMWLMHPLGAIISIVGVGWVIYRITRGEGYETGTLNASSIQKFYEKLLPSIKQHIKWVSVPLVILLALALTKSILTAFIAGAGIVAFLDKQTIQAKGLNRVAMLLLLYTVGFLFLLIATFKLTNPYEGIFYSLGEIFFSDDTVYFLEDVTRGL
mgnify:CR=1 FL=1